MSKSFGKTSLISPEKQVPHLSLSELGKDEPAKVSFLVVLMNLAFDVRRMYLCERKGYFHQVLDPCVVTESIYIWNLQLYSGSNSPNIP